MARKVIGPTGSRRRRWLFLCTTVVAFAVAAFFIAGAGAVTGTPSGFESGDGNMTLLGGSGTDWNCFQGTTGPGGSTFATLASTPAGCTVTSGATQTWSDGGTTGVGSTENQFKSGSKFDDACVVINAGNNPPKDEWTNIAEYTESAPTTNDLYFYGASIRPVVNGNTSGNIYFSQTSNGCHTVGDVLLAFNFLNGGGTPSLSSLRWIASGTCFVSSDSAPCWGNLQSINQAGLFDGSVNTGTINATDNGISGTTLPANAFAEFGINLTQAIKVGNPNGTLPCFANQTWVSRSSGSSFTSNPEDVEVVNRPTCGSITIIKHTQDGTGARSGVDQSFGYTTTGGLTPNAFNLNDKAGCDPSNTCTTATNTQSYTLVPQGAYTVTEAGQDGFTFKSLTCTHQGTGTTAAQNGTTTEADITLGVGGSAVCTYTNRQNTASLATQQSTSASVFPGQDVTDTATVTGSNTSLNPAGTVTFYLCGPHTTDTGCSSSDLTRGSAGTGTLGNGSNGVSTATSSPAVNTSGSPLAAGHYCFEATWAGDTNYPGALDVTSATNECFTVRTIPTTTTTSPSSSGSPLSGNVNFGDQTIYDHAVVQADQTGDGVPTGSVSFTLCSPSQMLALSESTCASGGTPVGSAVTLGSALNGVSPPAAAADSDAFANGGAGVNQTGTWCWKAVFSPSGTNGSNYTGSSDTRVSECFTVVDTTSGSSAQSWLPNDTATVTAAHNAPLNGSLSLQLYTDDNCGVTTGSAISGQLYSKPLAGATTAAARTITSNNTTEKVSASSSVSWLMTFTSTDTNVAGITKCEKSSLTITN